jgi:DNA primase
VIPDETVERVRESADIVAIVGEYVKLRRSGGDYRGPCPFHGGKNPNFSVSPRRNAYHCFKCGVSGDAIEFVRQHLGLDFVDAVKLVGERSGIVVEDVRVRREPEHDAREPLWEANAAAMELFQEQLWTADEAADARAYLASRGIARDTAGRFRLGYAPRGRALQDRLNALGHDDARLLDAGLLVRREEGDEPYPRFRDRLMIPILDARERCVGFGGRTMGDSDRAAKYLNSPETAVFSKGQLLYHLHAAKGAIRRAEHALVVEGYFDVIRVASAGLEQVVAGLGTALTSDQAALLTRLTKHVFLLYDSDEAGQKATFRAAHELLRLGASVRVVTLPEGEDPDTFVRAHGAAGLSAQLDAALDVFERQVQILERRGWFADLHRKRRAIDRLLPTIRAAADPLTRDLYINRLAETAGVSRDLIVREAAGDGPARARRPAPRPDPEGTGGRPTNVTADGRVVPDWPRSSPEKIWRPRRGGDRRRPEEGWHVAPGVARSHELSAGTIGERTLLRMVLADRSAVEEIAERVGASGFRDPVFRDIFTALLREGPHAELDALERGLTPGTAAVMYQLLEEGREAATAPDFDLRRTLDEALVKLQVRELSERIDELQRSVPLAGGAEQDRLMLEIADLQREVRTLSGPRGPWKVMRGGQG